MDPISVGSSLIESIEVPIDKAHSDAQSVKFPDSFYRMWLASKVKNSKKMDSNGIIWHDPAP